LSKRNRAAAVAIAVSAAGLMPVAAHAASSTTIYVDGGNNSCFDGGTGTVAQPFCTLQPAVDAMVPGDTVVVNGSGYLPVTITKSGTAAQPITIEAAAGSTTMVSDSTPPSGVPAFAFNGASYVTVTNISAENVSQYATFAGSSHITLDSFRAAPTFGQSAPSGFNKPGVEISGDSSDITVSRGAFFDIGRTAPSLQIDAGSSGDVVSTNFLQGGDPSIVVNGATGTAITSNTVVASSGAHCGSGILLTGASTGSSIENNVIEPAAGCAASGTPAPTGLLNVASTATPGTTVDYNLLGPGNKSNEYAWAGHYYQTAATFNAATGQGAHDITADPQLQTNGMTYYIANQSPVINSADSAAPGELPTDISGSARINDPLIPDSGAGTSTYYDRGAEQLQVPGGNNWVDVSGNGALGVTANTVEWSSTGYSFNFGDGTGAVPGAYGAAQHTYKTQGTYTITVTGTDSGTGKPFSNSTTFSTPVSATMWHDVRNADGSWQSSGWGVPSGSTAFQHAALTAMPDGSTQFVAVSSAGQLEHNIRFANGSWQGWRTLSQPGVVVYGADIAGMRDGSAQIIEIVGGGVVLHNIRYAGGAWQPQGWASIGGSQDSSFGTAALTAMPDGSTQFVAVNGASGLLEHNIRHANGTWQGWNVVHQREDFSIYGADIAGMPDGSAQIVEETGAGVLHDIRYASGAWQPQGWSSVGAPTGSNATSITAMPDGSSQFVDVTSSGKIYHDIRFANGSWQHQGWAALSQPGSLPAISAGLAGFPNGSSQLIALTKN
jgi:hypothetical protein